MRAKKDHGKARDRAQREKYEAFDRLLNCDESIFLGSVHATRYKVVEVLRFEAKFEVKCDRHEGVG